MAKEILNGLFRIIILTKLCVFHNIFYCAAAENITYSLYISFSCTLHSSKPESGFSAAQQQLQQCKIVNDTKLSFVYPQIVKNHDDLIELSKFVDDSNISGVMGHKNYFISILRLPSNILGQCSLGEKSLFVDSIDPTLLQFARVAVAYLRSMRISQNVPFEAVTQQERTLLIIPRYFATDSDPFKNSEIEVVLKLLGTPVNIFWQTTEDNCLSIVSSISKQKPTNVIILSSGENLNKLLLESYYRNQFVFERRWIIMPTYGDLPNLPSNLSVVSENVTIIHLGNTKETLEEQTWSGIDKLAYDAGYLGYNYLSDICCNKPGSGETELHTGIFNLSDVNSPRMRTDFLIYRKLGSNREMVGYIEVGTDVKINASNVSVSDGGENEIMAILNSRPIRVAVALAAPFVMLEEGFTLPKNSNAIIHPDNLTGFSIDIIKQLFIDADYEITLFLEDGTGIDPMLRIIASVKQGMSDIAIGDFAVMPEMLKDFDFLTDYEYFSLSVLTLPKNVDSESWLFLCFEPLSTGFWILGFFSAIIVALSFATLNYLSPNEIDYRFIESIFFVFGSLSQGHAVSPPNRSSSRVLFSVWCLYVLFIVIIYFANYGAIQMHKSTDNNVIGFKALLADTAIPFGAVERSMANMRLKESNQGDKVRVSYLIDSIFSQKPSSIEEAVDLVRKGEYRLIGDSFTLQYYANQFCLSASDEYKSERYAMLIQKNSVYKPYWTDRLEFLEISKTIEVIKDRYLKSKICETRTNIVSKSAGANLRDIGGIFIFLAIGIVAFIVLVVIEVIFWRKFNVSSESSSGRRVRNFF